MERIPYAPGERKTDGPRFPYLPGLDGLRAFAVVAVLLYHAGLVWIPGGFLGVEVFFVISGYLITALLLAEYRERGRIDFKQFWLRRARRLLPALYILLVVTLAYCVFFLPAELARLRSDALAAFGYVTNWYLIFRHQSYFEAIGRPSLLKHLWSLAVEEQFYLIWPLLLSAGLAILRRERYVLPLILVGAGASGLLMAFLYHPGTDPSRVYYGTDTRAAGLLIGAALAFVWVPEQQKEHKPADMQRYVSRGWRVGNIRRKGDRASFFLDLLGVAALVGLVLFCLRVGESDSFLYRGGFALVSVMTAVVISICVHPQARLGSKLLDWPPLRWVGVRSYGIYLWHWPVFTVTRPNLDVPFDGLPLLALRLVTTLALATLSYRYVETPIRRGALERAWRRTREAQGRRRLALGFRWAASTIAVCALCVPLGVAVVQAQPPKDPSHIPTKAIHTKPSDIASTKKGRSKEDKSKSEGLHRKRQAKRAGAAPTPEPSTREAAGTSNQKSVGTSASRPKVKGPVSAIGDSVMLGAAAGGQLKQDIPDLGVVDSQVGLQVENAIGILEKRRAQGQLGNVVVAHLGTNGTFTAEEFDRIMEVLKSAQLVVFVNDKVPQPWEESNNKVISEGVRRHKERATLVDWHGASESHPEYFYSDSIHLNTDGRAAYAHLISEKINSE